MEDQSIVFRFPTERERRCQVNDSYVALRSLIPNPNPIKRDRASVIKEGIVYIKELRTRVNELKNLVEKKKMSKEEQPFAKMSLEDENMEKKPESDVKKKSKVTQVYVKIVDDEVLMKVVQKKKMKNCLLLIFKVLDQLHLDLHHVIGGKIGDNYSFLLKTKKCEGATECASAIANRVIEAVDQPVPCL